MLLDVSQGQRLRHKLTVAKSIPSWPRASVALPVNQGEA